MARKPDPKKRIFTYEEVDELVKQYKTGSREAIDSLFKAFQGFIAKYANFLKYGTHDKRDTDIFGLIRMLCPKGDDIRSRLELIKAALRSFEYEDIIGELNIMFMEACLHFQKRADGPHFAGYLYSYFKFKVKRWVDQRLKDVLNTVNLVELTDQEVEMQMLEDTQEFENTFSKARPVLDEVTRWILHLHYAKGLTDKAVADIVNVRPNWIFRQRRAAVKRLKALGIEKVEEVIRGAPAPKEPGE